MHFFGKIIITVEMTVCKITTKMAVIIAITIIWYTHFSIVFICLFVCLFCFVFLAYFFGSLFFCGFFEFFCFLFDCCVCPSTYVSIKTAFNESICFRLKHIKKKHKKDKFAILSVYFLFRMVDLRKIASYILLCLFACH